MPQKTIPQSAYCFELPPPEFVASETEGAHVGEFTGMAYSGEVVTEHPFWEAVIFDVSSITIPDRIPALIQHDRGQRAGFCGLTITDNQIFVSNGVLINNRHGSDVFNESKAGFPWQLSVHISPGRIEEVRAGEKLFVNGAEITGPLYIFRDSLVRELSFTPTGADHRTEANAMSSDGDLLIFDEGDNMDTVEQLQEKLIAEQGKSTQFKADLDAAVVERDQFKADLDAANAKIDGINAAARKKEVQDLFTATGLEFTEESAAPYITMDATTFAAVGGTLRDKIKTGSEDDNADLFSSTVTGGDSSGSNSAVVDAMAASI